MQQEKIVETKICKHCNLNFEITDKDLEFYDKVSPVFGGKKYNIPTPTLCPDCRQQRRMSFRNERKLYKRKSDITGTDIISIYSPDKLYKVYQQEYWQSDQWTPTDYGIEFDFTRGFFEQFSDLMQKIPRIGLANNQKNENSPYVTYTAESKNIYMATDVVNSEDLYFGNTIIKVKNSIDLTNIENSEDCYECFSCQNLYNCLYTYQSQDCSNSIGLFTCKNVNYSLFCVNLINKDYHIFNQKCTKQEYEQFKKACQNRKVLDENIKKFYELILKLPKKVFSNINIDNCVGDNLLNSQNCFFCYEGVNIRDCKYCVIAHTMDDCMDTTIHNPDCTLDYEAVCGGRLSNSQFNITGWECNNIRYCDSCYLNSSHLFGCIGLKSKSYCILNKQYTKEQYEILVPKIIEHMKKTGEWGEFFPSSISPFGYNETVAQEYFPLTKEEVIKKGFNWSDYEQPFPKVEKIIPANKLPDNIADIPDDILNRAIECEITKKPFRIIKQELEFYRKHNLPIPKRHPDQRHLDRMIFRNPRKLFDRKCDKCGKEIKTTYSLDKPEIVYCEECYNKTVY